MKIQLSEIRSILRSVSRLESIETVNECTWAGKREEQKQIEINTRKGIQLSIYTGERGPRTDHGGGEDGDGWMDHSQVQRLQKAAEKRWKPEVVKMKEALARRGFNLKESHIEYGEKGHISIDIVITLKKVTSKKNENKSEEKKIEKTAEKAPKSGSKTEEILTRLKKGQKSSQIQKEMNVYYSQVKRVIDLYM